ERCRETCSRPVRAADARKEAVVARILHAIQELRMGGAERIVVALAAGAQRAGHVVGVASGPGELSRNLERWFPLPVVARHPAQIPAATIALERARRRLGANLIHFH